MFAKQLFFIVGAPKSGTTWLQLLLDAHPAMVCRGESHFVDIFYLELSRQLDRFNRQVLQQGGIVAHHRQYGGHVDTLKYGLNDANYLLVLAMGLMFEKWTNDPTVAAIGEKTPDTLEYLPLLGSLLPNAKIIHLIRDPRDCAVSAWFFQQSNLDRNRVIRRTFDEFVLDFGRFWCDRVPAGRSAGMDLGERYLEIYYEDLLNSPQAQLARITGFLGVSSGDADIQNSVRAARFQRQSGGRRPGEEDPDSFFRKGVAGDWRNHFDPDLVDRFHEVVAPTMARFGYRADSLIGPDSR